MVPEIYMGACFFIKYYYKQLKSTLVIFHVKHLRDSKNYNYIPKLAVYSCFVFILSFWLPISGSGTKSSKFLFPFKPLVVSLMSTDILKKDKMRDPYLVSNLGLYKSSSYSPGSS